MVLKYGGNKGVLPEQGRASSPVVPTPKPQPKTLGKELYEITKKVNDKINKEAAREAEVLFHALCIKDRAVEEANKGNNTYFMPLNEFEELMKKNNLHSDTSILLDKLWDLLNTMDMYVYNKKIGEEEMVVFQWHE